MVHITKTLPGTDCRPDHELLKSQIKIKLKKASKPITSKKYDLNNITYDCTVIVLNRLESPQNLWEDTKVAISKTAKESIPLAKARKKS